MSEYKVDFIGSPPPQKQDRSPGIESEMVPPPVFDHDAYKHADKLRDKVAVITGGDSGIGRATAVAFAKENAKAIAIMYYDEHDDAATTKKIIEECGAECITIAGDIANEEFCNKAIKEIGDKFGKIDILVNNAADHWPQESILDISSDQLKRTFDINVFSIFYLTKACIPYL